jgi:hypothetical protein
VHLAPGEFMPRVMREAGIEHVLDVGAPGQERGDGQRIR